MSPRQAIVLVDPLNDFLDTNGKLYPLLKESLTTTDTVSHIRELVDGARVLGVPIYYGLHQSYKEGHYAGWLHLRASHVSINEKQTFSGWGGEIVPGLEPQLANGDVVVSRHWNSSSFANTDLDYQLRQREITHLIMAGMVANTCLEATARDATELGYKVTFLKDTTAGFSDELKAAGEVAWPTLFEEVMTAKEWLASQRQSTVAKI